MSNVQLCRQIDGTFSVKKPAVLLGYTQGRGKGEVETVQARTDDLYLTLFVTIEPPLAPAEKFSDKVTFTFTLHRTDSGYHCCVQLKFGINQCMCFDESS